MTRRRPAPILGRQPAVRGAMKASAERRFPDMDGREERDEDLTGSRPITHHGRRAGAAGARAGRRYETRPGSFRDVVQPAGAEAFRPRHALPAFVLVPGVADRL